MSRARRLVAVATVAALGVVGIGACARANPEVAAYLDDATISLDRVEGIYLDAERQFLAAATSPPAGPTPEPTQEPTDPSAAPAEPTPAAQRPRVPIGRQDVANLLISMDLGKRVATEKRFNIGDDVKPEDVAQALRLPARAQYVQLWAEWIDIFSALQALPPAEATDEALVAVYQAVGKVTEVPPNLSPSELRAQLGDGFVDIVRAVTGVTSALEQEAERIGTTINPRFRPISMPSALNSQGSLLVYSLPYLNEDGPVRDVDPAADARAE